MPESTVTRLDVADRMCEELEEILLIGRLNGSVFEDIVKDLIKEYMKGKRD
jgi:hypothetical protein